MTHPRSFRDMDPAKQRALASAGGKLAHKLGVAHEWTSDQAREAGRKGGIACAKARAARKAALANPIT